jgi:hypothetical protein
LAIEPGLRASKMPTVSSPRLELKTRSQLSATCAPGDSGQAIDRVDVAKLIEIDDVEGVVRRVGDEQPPKLAVDCGVIEAAIPAMLGKLDVALETE